jgi:Heterokaryon incompatibility protein (HET)
MGNCHSFLVHWFTLLKSSYIHRKHKIKPYVYTDLESTAYSRLIRVKRKNDTTGSLSLIEAWSFEIIHVKRSEAPEYEAVSYVWGCQEKNESLVLGDSRVCLLTSSLFSALPHFAFASTTGYLWIDQICINQSDLKERGHQVEVMRSIYRDAQRVLAWVGTMDQEHSASLLELIHVTESALSEPLSDKLEYHSAEVAARVSPFLSAKPGQDSHLLALLNLLNREWFYRAWIFQEVTICPNLVLMIGNIQIKGLKALWALSVATRFVLEKSTEYHQITSCRGYAELTTMSEVRSELLGHGWTRRFHEMVDRAGSREATDPRDFVYGCLGFLDDPRIVIEPKYDIDLKEAYVESTKAIIMGTGSLDVLCVVRQPGTTVALEHALPSWVPDWSAEREVNLLCTTSETWGPTKFDASDRRLHVPEACIASNLEILAVRGVSIGDVIFVTPTLKTPREDALIDRVKSRLGLDYHMDQLISNSPQVGEVTRERLLQVLLADGVNTFPGSTHPFTPEYVAELLLQYDTICNPNFDHTDPNNKAGELCQSLDQHLHIAKGRTSFCSSEGKLGLGPTWMEANDQVVIAHGARTPLLLRSSGTSGEYWFVGPCYLEDSMLGEACT